MRVISILFLCFFTSFLLFGQEMGPLAEQDRKAMEELEDTLGVLGYLMLDDSMPETRFAAVQKMIPTLVKALNRPNSFQYPFEQLQVISIQYPADSSFRIFTWQLQVNQEEFRYYGAIQKRSSKLELIPLIDRSFELENERFTQTDGRQWYGALYYNLITLPGTPEPIYLLFGFDNFQGLKRRKLIEPLRFTQEGVQFGAPVFPAMTDEAVHGSPLQRFILEYDGEASVRLNYDAALEKIVFDHLVEIQGKNGLTQVPDGSYEAFEIKEGQLEHVEKLYNATLEEPLLPKPVLGKEGGEQRDILGRKKN